MAIKSQSGIDWLTFEGEDAEDALVHTAERFPADEAFQPFYAERELAEGEGTLARQSATPKPREVPFSRVIRAVDDPQVLRPPALHGRLGGFTLPNLLATEAQHRQTVEVGE